MVLALARSLAITRLASKPIALASRRAPYYHTSYSTNTQKRTTKMSDKEEQSPKLDLNYTPERAEELKENIEAVQKEIDEVWAEVEGQGGVKPRLVAVSKLKPASDIKALYDAGYRHFGENYIQEMVDKAHALPTDIKWHFIGALQSNKAKLAASIPNLYVLETLSSIKTANMLNKATPDTQTLNVYIQINTSSEDAKSGVQPLSPSKESDPEPNPEASELIDLATHILTECPRLRLHGLMTIGSLSASTSKSSDGGNPDFDTLKSTRTALVQALKAKGVKGAPENEGELELSMGMSADFKEAVKQGSSGVRVGTRIFGERPKKVKAGDGQGVTK